jgi:hypothetical protein
VSDPATPTGAAALLRSTAAIRERAQGLLARARRGESAYFTVNDAALDNTAAVVAEVTRARYPTLAIPYHSRWRHFEAGGVDRAAQLTQALGDAPAAVQARARIDLALVSVLLDAGAGPDWLYREAGRDPGRESACALGREGSRAPAREASQDAAVEAPPGAAASFNRSEGLGVASFHAFMDGLFSSDPAQPLQADADGLRAVTAESIARAFQVGPDNPLVGVEGRAALLRRLGDALAAQPEVFGRPGRPGGLFDHLTGARRGPAGQEAHGADAATAGATLEAHDIFTALLDTLSGIWPARSTLGGNIPAPHAATAAAPDAAMGAAGDSSSRVNASAKPVPLGDCWRHPAVRGPGLTDGWMPFHKLSQWLAYSLLEPFEWAGVRVTGLDRLTGLPEYRNGGLLLDGGVLRWRDEALAARAAEAADPHIVEWRALTVALLDELAPRVRAQLGVPAEAMPLACVLEGGTWAAGRVLAQRLRGGLPPLNITSDGTVF